MVPAAGTQRGKHGRSPVAGKRLLGKNGHSRGQWHSQGVLACLCCKSSSFISACPTKPAASCWAYSALWIKPAAMPKKVSAGFPPRSAAR
nr:MAG TPA: hypothetical protein [Caudoviricetes sp.]